MPTLTQIIAQLFAARKKPFDPSEQSEPLFAGQRYASPERKQRRKIIARLGRRQGLKWIKHVRANRRANRAELASVA